MAKEIRARFSHGVLEPLEALDLKEGEEVKVLITERPQGKGMINALRASAGGWKGLIEAEELQRNIYADRLISTRPEPKLITYLIDTDWVIDHLNHIERVTRRLEALAPAGLALSLISLAELYEGVYYSRDPVESEATLQRFLNPELTMLVLMKKPAKFLAKNVAGCERLA